jgi:hypothetical protein
MRNVHGYRSGNLIAHHAIIDGVPHPRRWAVSRPNGITLPGAYGTLRQALAFCQNVQGYVTGRAFAAPLPCPSAVRKAARIVERAKRAHGARAW